MSYKCPRCGEPVHRGYSRGAQMAGGLVGALFYSAFGAFECKRCGKIAREEFTPEDRAKMARGTLFLVLGAVAVLAIVIWLFSIS